MGSATMDGTYHAVVIGASAGGMKALLGVLAPLSAEFRLPVVVAQHVHATQGPCFVEHLNRETSLTVKEAQDKETVQSGFVYVAPPNYHLLVERGGTLSLSIDEKVNFSRPSIDVLFESAAHAWAPGLIGVILTGANHDGAQGLRLIRELGGLTIAQDPATADYPFMPQAAIDAGAAWDVLPIAEISKRLEGAARPK